MVTITLAQLLTMELWEAFCSRYRLRPWDLVWSCADASDYPFTITEGEARELGIPLPPDPGPEGGGPC